MISISVSFGSVPHTALVDGPGKTVMMQCNPCNPEAVFRPCSYPGSDGKK